MLRQLCDIPFALHLCIVALFSTQEQLLAILLPFQVTLIRNGESTHKLHVPHVSEHVVDTPSNEQRHFGVFVATHSQLLHIFFPSGLKVRKRNGESIQEDVFVGEEVGTIERRVVGKDDITGNEVGGIDTRNCSNGEGEGRVEVNLDGVVVGEEVGIIEGRVDGKNEMIGDGVGGIVT